MSEVVRNKGRLIPVMESIEKIANDVAPEEVENFIEYPYDYGYEIIKGQLYKVEWEVKGDESLDFAEVKENEDGTISFHTLHYNGGVCWSEVVEGLLVREDNEVMKNKKQLLWAAIDAYVKACGGRTDYAMDLSAVTKLVLAIEELEAQVSKESNTPCRGCQVLKEQLKQEQSYRDLPRKCGSLWSVGKFISTVGNVSAETIKKYIADQKGK